MTQSERRDHFRQLLENSPKQRGRPPVEDRRKNRTIRMNDAEFSKYMQLGASKWFMKQLKAAKL